MFSSVVCCHDVNNFQECEVITYNSLNPAYVIFDSNHDVNTNEIISALKEYGIYTIGRYGPVIKYKDEKDKEIEKLKYELDKFQKMVEDSKNSYEEILDKTTKSIEKFIENTEINEEKNIQ